MKILKPFYVGRAFGDHWYFLGPRSRQMSKYMPLNLKMHSSKENATVRRIDAELAQLGVVNKMHAARTTIA